MQALRHIGKTGAFHGPFHTPGSALFEVRPLGRVERMISMVLAVILVLGVNVALVLTVRGGGVNKIPRLASQYWL